MRPTDNHGRSNSQSLPTEIWMQIICNRSSGLSLVDLTRLCRVNKNFREIAMEAILESEELRYVGYWDPIRKTTVRYGRKVRKEHFVRTLGNDDIDNDNDTDSDSNTGSMLPHENLPHPPMPPDDSEHSSSDAAVLEEQEWSESDESEDSVESSESEDFDDYSDTDNSGTEKLTPGRDFWIELLKARTIGRIRTKPPTPDHVLTREVAEYIWQWKLDKSSLQEKPSETNFEDMVRAVCEVAVRYGYIHDRRAFFLGTKSHGSEAKSTVMDEFCAIFHDALLNVAVFIDDTNLLESILSIRYTVLCLDHSAANGTSDENETQRAPFKSRIPRVKKVSRHRSAAFKPPECGNSLIRLGNPVKVAVQTGNMQCTSMLLKSLAGDRSELNLCRQDIITTASLPKQIEFFRLAVDADPLITAYNIILPSLSSHLFLNGRSYLNTRSSAGVALSKILETTTDIEVFNLAYDAILAGFDVEEGVWWTKPPKTFSYAAHTLSSWGTKRLQRAVLDDCLPIVERLFQLGYNLDPNHSLAEANDENRDLVKYLIDSEITRDKALPTAVWNGNVRMVELLFKEGAGRNRKNVRKAIYAGIYVGSTGGGTEMLRLITSQPGLEGLFNQGYRRCFRRDFDVEGRRHVWQWLESL
ncbi:hypothetical protein DER45DRAFT_575890 [Fusarium avenaceum]|nr:hypothetical protein DER45DRAFT_575890 [Fusarium avenaceum]